ncbi:hypothetical protein RCL1_006339 [Eukaryota sp. TZLM3-RCL]
MTQPIPIIERFRDTLPVPRELCITSSSFDFEHRSVPRTTRVGICLCVHVGYEPPDDFFIEEESRAVLECFLKPSLYPRFGFSKELVKEIRNQYKQIKVSDSSMTVCVDIAADEIHRLCTELRRNYPTEQYDSSKRSSTHSDRILFHYNGHGVPKPTNTELWFLNRNHTKYIPIKIEQTARYLGNPTTYVLDCSNAGALVPFLSTIPDVYVFAACSAGQILPISPELPADLLTSCLTSPIETSILWYLYHNHLHEVPFDPYFVLTRIKLFNNGPTSDKKTILGDLNSIFTAITDAICWSVLPVNLFNKYLRNDNPSAFLFRHFLLADRIFPKVGVVPISVPKFPNTCHHFLWAVWDRTMDLFMRSLQWDENFNIIFAERPCFFAEQLESVKSLLTLPLTLPLAPPISSPTSSYYLPILLQAIIGQAYREPAIELLALFVDNGQSSIEELIHVGFLAYLKKLVDSKYSKPEFIHIWVKLFAFLREHVVGQIEGRSPGSQGISSDSKSKMMDMKLFINIALSSSCGHVIRSKCFFILAQYLDESPGNSPSIIHSSKVQKIIDLLSVSEISEGINDSSFNFYLLWLLLCVSKIYSVKSFQLENSHVVVHALQTIFNSYSNHLIRAASLNVLSSVFLYFSEHKTVSKVLISAIVDSTFTITSDTSPLVRREGYRLYTLLLEHTYLAVLTYDDVTTAHFKLNSVDDVMRIVVTTLSVALLDPLSVCSSIILSMIPSVQRRLIAARNNHDEKFKFPFELPSFLIEFFDRLPLANQIHSKSSYSQKSSTRRSKSNEYSSTNLFSSLEVLPIFSVATNMIKSLKSNDELNNDFFCAKSQDISVDQMRLNLRNQSILQSTSRDYNQSGFPICSSVGFFQLSYTDQVPLPVSQLLLHPFDLYSIAVGKCGTGFIHNWNPHEKDEDAYKPQNYFSLAPYSFLQFLNSEVTDAFLLDENLSKSTVISATSDGAVFVSQVPDKNVVELSRDQSVDSLIAAFRPVPMSSATSRAQYWDNLSRHLIDPNFDPITTRNNNHFITHSPTCQHLFSSAPGNSIAVCDLNSLTLLNTYAIPDVAAQSTVSAVCCHDVSLFSSGYLSGDTTFFDLRDSSIKAAGAFKFSESSVVKISQHLSRDNLAVSFYDDGKILTHDLRNLAKPVAQSNGCSTKKSRLVSCSLHPRCDLVATLDSANQITFFDLNLQKLSCWGYTSLYFMNHAQATTLQFHPTRVMMGVVDDQSALSFLARDRNFRYHYDGTLYGGVG